MICSPGCRSCGRPERSSKEIVRALGAQPATVTPPARAIARPPTAVPKSAMAGRWVSSGWSTGLTTDGNEERPDVTVTDHGGGQGRDRRRHAAPPPAASVGLRLPGRRYCLGVKNAVGPEVLNDRDMAAFLHKGCHQAKRWTFLVLTRTRRT